MPTDEELLITTNLRALTSLGVDELRAAAARAQTAGKRAMSNTIKVKQVGDHSIDYSIRGPGGVVEQLAFTLSWEAGAEGARTAVVTRVGNYLTVRPKMFGIAYGQKRVPALKSFQQFVDWMKREMAS